MSEFDRGLFDVAMRGLQKAETPHQREDAARILLEVEEKAKRLAVSGPNARRAENFQHLLEEASRILARGSFTKEALDQAMPFLRKAATLYRKLR